MAEVISINDRIRDLLMQRGITQKALAELIHVERSHLSRLLSGARSWQVEQLERVAEVLELAHSELVQGTDAEGLDSERKTLEDANEALREQVGDRIAEVQVLQKKLASSEEREAELRKQKDEAKSELEKATLEREALRRRPTREEHEAVCAERDRASVREKSLAEEVETLKKQLAVAKKNEGDLQKSLKESHAQLLTNFRAAEHWKSVAEKNGTVLKGAAFAAAGLGFLSLLGRGGGDDDDDDLFD